MTDRPATAPDLEDADVFRPAHETRGRRRFAGVSRDLGVLAAVAVGGGLGSLGRYLTTIWLPSAPPEFPWATFVVNVFGCLVLGVVMVLLTEVWRPGRYLRPFLAIGVLGGLTTFSTLALDAHGLARHGAWLLASGYVLASLLAGFGGLLAGATGARVATGVPIQRAPRRERKSAI